MTYLVHYIFLFSRFLFSFNRWSFLSHLFYRSLNSWSFSCSLSTTATTSSFLLLVLTVDLVKVYQFDHTHLCIITLTISRLNDTSVTSWAISHFRSNY